MKRILVITGSRSEYGLLKPLLRSIEQSRQLYLQLAATGSHVSKIFGETIQEIKKDFNIDAIVDLPLGKDTNAGMSIAVGKSVMEFTQVFRKLKPDVVVILGDRFEIFGVAIAAFYMNIPIAHIHGGDRSGGSHLDDSVRHAITKLSHIHFTSTAQSARRVIKLGEESWRVHVVGALGIDAIYAYKRCHSKKNGSSKQFKVNSKEPLVILLQHPVTTEAKDGKLQIRNSLNAIKELALQTVVIYPNADAGSRTMMKTIGNFKKYPLIQIRNNLSHDEFLGLMASADVILGNSSAAIIEAPAFRLPIVNIGTRQNGRERGDGFIDVGYDKDGIMKAIKRALSKKFRENIKQNNIYGDGKASRRIVSILSNLEINKRLLQKEITY